VRKFSIAIFQLGSNIFGGAVCTKSGYLAHKTAKSGDFAKRVKCILLCSITIYNCSVQPCLMLMLQVTPVNNTS